MEVNGNNGNFVRVVCRRRRAVMSSVSPNEQSILSRIPCGIVVLDRSKRMVYANARTQHLTGLSLDSLIGKDLGVLGLSANGQELSQSGQEWWQWAEGATIHLRAFIRDRNQKSIPVFVSGVRSLNGPEDDYLYLGILDMAHLEDWALGKQFHENSRGRFYGLVGHTSCMQDLYRLIEMASETAVNVIIQGKSGTGKELVASAIHQASSRAGGPFVRVNCASLVETLLESELFGHVKGAFTGAHRDSMGKFEAAHQGTLLLDEIGEIGPAMQVKLLRVLQERVITRVGDTREIPVDVRIIAATNRDLRSLVRKKTFREDLFYRLNVLPVHVPSLNERKNDIPLLCAHFLEKFRGETGKHILSISTDAMRLLMGYCWPGNVRELENAIEHAFVLCRSDEIVISDLPYELRVKVVRDGICAEKDAELSHPVSKIAVSPAKVGGRLNISIQQLTAELANHDGNKSAAARALGISKVGLWKKMKKMGLL